MTGRLPSRLAPLALLLLASAGAAGCASPWRRETVYTGGDVVVYREHRESSGQVVPLGHDHPAEVSPEDLAYVFGSLRHERKPILRDVEFEPVFRPDEIGPLSKVVSATLADLTPDERVRFLVIRGSLARVFVGISGVSGVVFRTGDTLNVAFDAIEEAVHEGDGGRPEDVSFPYEPTEIVPKYGLVTPFVFSEIRRDPASGKPRKRWLEVNLTGLASSSRDGSDRVATPTGGGTTARDAAAGASAAAGAGAGAVTPPVGTDVASSEGSAAAGASTDAPEAPVPADAGASGGAGGVTLDDIERRLARLKELRERGALTDEEYEAARDRVLEDL